MRRSLLILISFHSFSQAQAQMPTSGQNPASMGVVLGYNIGHELNSQFTFPCIANRGVLFCDNKTLLIEDVKCSQTLKFKEIKAISYLSISCITNQGQAIELATKRKHTQLEIDITDEDTGYFYLDFNSRVQIQTKKIHPYAPVQQFLVIK